MTKTTILAAICIPALLAACGGGGTAVLFTGKVSSLKEGPEFLGPGWECALGLVVDDLKDLSPLSPVEREAAKPVAAAGVPKGITACADFSYRRPDDLMKFVTLRIFIFDAPGSARAWWKEKYGAPGWEAHYRTVSGMGELAVDALELPKRIVLAGNVLLTCHQLEKGDEHLKVLARYLARLGIR